MLIGDHRTAVFDGPVLGAIVQYPASDGTVYDYSDFAEQVHDAGGLLVAAADLLSLTLLKPPGEFDADIAVGSTQRFGGYRWGMVVLTPLSFQRERNLSVKCREELQDFRRM